MGVSKDLAEWIKLQVTTPYSNQKGIKQDGSKATIAIGETDGSHYIVTIEKIR